MIIQGDALAILSSMDAQSIDCVVTSPPYWGLRDYGVEGQLGLERTPDEYVANMVAVFREARRVLKDTGTLWLNLGDSYAGNAKSGGKNANSGGPAFRVEGTPNKTGNGIKPKDLVGIPWRVAFALQADGWYLRQDIIWHKPNPMPESVRDRCTKAHEYIFMLSKSERYHFDHEAIKEPFADKRQGNPGKYKAGLKDCVTPQGVHGKGVTGNGWNADGKITGRNRRSVWSITTKPFKGAHFATFPPDLIEPCILAGCPKGGVVLDPFFGAGTVGLVAKRHGREYVGIEINAEYAAIAEARIEHASSKD